VVEGTGFRHQVRRHIHQRLTRRAPRPRCEKKAGRWKHRPASLCSEVSPVPLLLGACRGAKPLCVTSRSPFGKGGLRGIGSGRNGGGRSPPCVLTAHGPRLTALGNPGKGVESSVDPNKDAGKVSDLTLTFRGPTRRPPRRVNDRVTFHTIGACCSPPA